MRPAVWRPPAEPSPAEQVVIKAVRRARLFVFLREHRHELFDEEFQARLAAAYVDSPRGQPPARLALATILQAHTGVSDDEVVEATVTGRRWQLALDCLDAGHAPFSKGTLVGFRKRLIRRNLDRVLAGRSVELAAATRGFGAGALRAALAEVLGLLDQAGAFVAGWAGEDTAAAAVAVARQARDQDAGLAAAPVLRRGVARDRRISVEDAAMRHGRKSRSVRFDGYKRHVLRDPGTGLIVAAGITPANAPEASVTDSIAADLDAAGRRLSELHIDRPTCPRPWSATAAKIW